MLRKGCREVLECSGLPWIGPKDSGWTPKQWPELKADTAKCPFGQLPLLEARGGAGGRSVLREY